MTPTWITLATPFQVFARVYMELLPLMLTVTVLWLAAFAVAWRMSRTRKQSLWDGRSLRLSLLWPGGATFLLSAAVLPYLWFTDALPGYVRWAVTPEWIGLVVICVFAAVGVTVACYPLIRILLLRRL